jgi:predicted transcriptional regulator
MVKATDEEKRESYSVRLRPDLIQKVKHLAVDEKKSVSQIIEEGIEDLLKKYAKSKK